MTATDSDQTITTITVNGDLHLYLGHAPAILQSLQRVEAHLQVLRQQGVLQMTTVADLKAQADKTLAAITAESDKDDAIIALVQANTALITSLKDQLAAAIAGNDPAALQAVLDQLTAAETSALTNAQKVTDAINAGTTERKK